MKSSCIILTGLLTSVSLALVQVIAVDPVKAAWSGAVDTLPPNNYISQGLTCNFDLPVYAEFFTGTATEQQYQVKIVIPGTYPEVVVAEGDTSEARSHVWVRCTLNVEYPDSIIKGRVYEVRWTLSGGSDSLVYYYDSTDAYQWGQIMLPGQQQVPIGDPRDLAARVHGIMDTIGADWFGVNPYFPFDVPSLA